MIENPPLHAVIGMFNYYKNLANDTWLLDFDLVDIYVVYDYYKEQEIKYEQEILKQILT